MLATLQLYSSMHFISIFISDFVIIYSLIYLGLLCMLSVKLIAASINGTVSDLNKALSSGSTLNHKNLIKVSHL